MGLLEIDLGNVCKNIIAKGPEETEKLIRKLILCIERQHSAVGLISWSDDLRQAAKQTHEDLIKLFNELKVP